jgi:phage-related protein (TIGR01555 family)
MEKANKKSSKSDEQVILDGWQNALTGLGDPSRDKRNSAVPAPDSLSYADALDLIRADFMAQRIVCKPAEEMTREWFDVRIEDNEEAAEAIGARMADLKAPERFYKAIEQERLFGGSLIFIGANDGITDPSLPLNEKAIKSIDFLTGFDNSEAFVTRWQANPMDRDYGEPLEYQISPRVIGVDSKGILTRVHASRVIRFCGPVYSRILLNAKRGWGDSVLDVVWKVIRNFAESFSGAGALIQDFSQAVIKIKGLAAAIAADKSNLIKNRMMMLDLARSVLRAMVLDADNEDFERKPTPISGLDALLQQFAQQLAAAADIPLTVLMGQSPAGLSATGDSDIRQWYDHVRKMQNKRRPQFERLAKLLFLAKDGPTRGVEPKNWSLQFRSLWQESDGEKAKTRLTMAQADQIYLQTGVIDAGEVRVSRFGGDEYSIDTAIEGDSAPAETLAQEAEENGISRIDPNTGKPAQYKPGALVNTKPQTPTKDKVV